MKPKNHLSLALGCLLLVSAHAATNSTPTTATEPTKTCFQCSGAGKTKCPAAGCKEGQTDCPGPCLKLSKGTWFRKDGELWQKFTSADGRSAKMWNDRHIGEVIRMQNGKPVNIGQCTVCGGNARSQCTVCGATGQTACGVCSGKKVVPASWSAFDNPKMKDRPTRFTLKDGRVIVGRKKISTGTSVMIRTERSDIRVNTADIVSEEKPPAR